MRRSPGLVLVVALSASAAVAQTPSQTATAAIRGRVVDANGQGIPYARIRVDGAPIAVRAGVDGTFTIAARAGTTLVATKAGYARTTHKADASGTTAIALARAAVIAGRMTDSTGEPIVGATVSVAPAAGPASGRLTGVTDDRGDYRVGGLSAGSYAVSVTTAGAELAPVPGYVASTAAADGTREQASGYRTTSNVTFYPGTGDRRAATPVTVAAGEERGDINIQVPVERAWQQGGLATGLPGLVDTRVATADAATVQGTVADPDGRPLARAQVTVQGSASPQRTANGLLTVSVSQGIVVRTTTTDDQGRYQVTSLLPGAYEARAGKAGYAPPVSTLTSYMPARPVRAGEVATVDVTLVPLTVVSGRVRDEFGDPVEGTHVILMQTRYERGRRRLAPLGSADRATDDRGEFRISTGFTGDFLVAATVGDSSTGDLFGYARTFYPGTLAAEESRVVTLAGGETGGIDFALVGAPTTRVAGTVIDASGMPTAKAKVTLISRSSGTAMQTEARMTDDGTFELANIAPGQYILQADSGRTTMFSEGEFVALPISVGTADVLGLQVQLQPGSTITGRFVYDRFNRAVDPPPTAATIAAIPADFDLAPAGTASSQANAVGVFQLRNVTGARRLQVTRVPPRYMVKAILVGGRDVTDEALTFGRREQSLDDVEVVLTDRISELAGTVTDANGRAVDRATVVLFSTDRQKWHSGSRFLRTLTTNAMGAFTTTGLPFVSYFAAVVRSLPAGDGAWQDPAFLDSILDSAIVTAIDEGQNGPLALRAAR